MNRKTFPIVLILLASLFEGVCGWWRLINADGFGV